MNVDEAIDLTSDDVPTVGAKRQRPPYGEILLRGRKLIDVAEGEHLNKLATIFTNAAVLAACRAECRVHLSASAAAQRFTISRRGLPPRVYQGDELQRVTLAAAFACLAAAQEAPTAGDPPLQCDPEAGCSEGVCPVCCAAYITNAVACALCVSVCEWGGPRRPAGSFLLEHASTSTVPCSLSTPITVALTYAGFEKPSVRVTSPRQSTKHSPPAREGEAKATV